MNPKTLRTYLPIILGAVLLPGLVIGAASPPQREVLPSASHQEALPEPFASAVARLGAAFLGEVLSGPYQAADGNQEVIFENLVLYANAQNPGRALARPIVEGVGYSPQAPVQRLDTSEVLFFPLEGELGHNVPLIFNDYLAQHGGVDISGFPITEIMAGEEGTYMQCFTNLCLEYDPQADEVEKIRPAPLGRQYKINLERTPQAKMPPQSEVSGAFQLQLSEAAPLLAPGEEQSISIKASDNGTPLANLSGTLKVTLPDGSEVSYDLPATGEGGETKITLPPINAINGVLIPYQVCLDGGTAGALCRTDNFLIWGNH